MRHLKRTAKLGRTSEHRNAMLANLVCSLIKHKRVTTTLAKAKAARSVAEKMVTLGKSGTIHRTAGRRAVARAVHVQLTKDERRNGGRTRTSCAFKEIAPAFKERNGGYTRIVKMEPAPGRRRPARDFGMGGLHGRRPRRRTETAPAEVETRSQRRNQPPRPDPQNLNNSSPLVSGPFLCMNYIEPRRLSIEHRIEDRTVSRFSVRC